MKEHGVIVASVVLGKVEVALVAAHLKPYSEIVGPIDKKRKPDFQTRELRLSGYPFVILQCTQTSEQRILSKFAKLELGLMSLRQ